MVSRSDPLRRLISPCRTSPLAVSPASRVVPSACNARSWARTDSVLVLLLRGPSLTSRSSRVARCVCSLSRSEGRTRPVPLARRGSRKQQTSHRARLAAGTVDGEGSSMSLGMGRLGLGTRSDRSCRADVLPRPSFWSDLPRRSSSTAQEDGTRFRAMLRPSSAAQGSWGGISLLSWVRPDLALTRVPYPDQTVPVAQPRRARRSSFRTATPTR